MENCHISISFRTYLLFEISFIILYWNFRETVLNESIHFLYSLSFKGQEGADWGSSVYRRANIQTTIHTHIHTYSQFRVSNS